MNDNPKMSIERRNFPQDGLEAGKLREEVGFQLLKPEDVAHILKVAKVTPYQWARRGVLPHYRLEGTLRFKLEDIKAFVEARRVEKRK